MLNSLNGSGSTLIIQFLEPASNILGNPVTLNSYDIKNITRYNLKWHCHEIMNISTAISSFQSKSFINLHVKMSQLIFLLLFLSLYRIFSQQSWRYFINRNQVMSFLPYSKSLHTQNNVQTHYIFRKLRKVRSYFILFLSSFG